MDAHQDKPLIIQNDGSLLLEVLNPQFETARNKIILFAVLEKSPNYIHTYKINSMSLWNAAANNISAEYIKEILEKYSKFRVPSNISKKITDSINRYNLLSLEKLDDKLIFKSKDSKIIKEFINYSCLKPYIKERLDDNSLIIFERFRGVFKQEIMKLGYPIKDIAGYKKGESLNISLLPNTKSGKILELRDYQKDAISSFYEEGSDLGGNGVLVLPCGSGKTIIGLGIICKIKNETLILTSSTTAVRQWISEILDKTTLTEEIVGEYTGTLKEVKPITVATYQILTHKASKDSKFLNMELFNKRKWGLIIYDEVHLLPAPIFRYTANIQATRRLGLTATLVREDKKEEEVFTLIGPKKADIPWIQMEKQGWIASARCIEVRVPLSLQWKEKYFKANKRQRYRVAASNPLKINILREIIAAHHDDAILIIGQYVEQLEQIAEELSIPIITGKIKQKERDDIYRAFRNNKIKILVVSKVANFALDLPDAKVAIQVSGSFGSRQEEAQRLGRILRLKESNNAFFYTLVSQNTVDQEYAMKRQLFLVEQGYDYQIREKEFDLGKESVCYSNSI
ncbi:MAG: DNA repair helicase XPB [Vulcanibacillus sp.]